MIELKKASRISVSVGALLISSTIAVNVYAQQEPATGYFCAGLPATIVGTRGSEEISGTSGSDVIVGLGGDDIIIAGAGDDVVCAGSGNDDVRGGAGSDRLFGGSGEDILRGGSGADVVFGGDDDDLVYGGTQSADAEYDKVYGGDGDDKLRGGGNILLFGGIGDDEIRTSGSAGTRLRAFGQQGNDLHEHFSESVGRHSVTFFGSDGEDEAYFETDGNFVFYGGSGNDTVLAADGRAGFIALYGGAENDTLIGPADAIGGLIDGGEGDDLLASPVFSLPLGGLSVRGNDGNDTLLGTGLSGGEGDDVLYIDELSTGTFRGGAGDDNIYAEGFDALVLGNAGTDQIYAAPALFSGTINGGPGTDFCNDGNHSLSACEADQIDPPFDPQPLSDLYRSWYD